MSWRTGKEEDKGEESRRRKRKRERRGQERGVKQHSWQRIHPESPPWDDGKNAQAVWRRGHCNDQSRAVAEL